MVLNTGDQAPDFTLLSDTNEKITLSNLRGKKIVLYFYPKDNTPGCTKEACDFRDTFHQFSNENIIILGISKDKPLTHQKFKKKYELPFILLTDETGDVCIAYGAMKEKSLYGRSFLGIERSTFLIDEQGIIQTVWRKVSVPGHVEQVYHAL